jgi:hypothetical protein
VQEENPNVTLPSDIFEGASIDPGQDVFWAVDIDLEMPVLLEKHPFAISGLDVARFQIPERFRLRGADARMVRIPEPLRSEKYRGASAALAMPVQPFEPDQLRLFLALVEAQTSGVVAYVVSESELRERLGVTDEWANVYTNYSAVFEAGLGDTVPIADSLDAIGGSTSGPLFRDVNELLQVCDDVDGGLREIMRQVPNENAFEMVERQYSDLLQGRLLNHDIESEVFFKGLYDEEAAVVETVDAPDLNIVISRGMDAVSFRTDRGSLTIDEPRLLWDCHCGKPVGNFAEEQRPASADDFACPIHGHELGAYVTDLFRTGLVCIEYEGLDVLWKESQNLWPPSVDAVRMYETLRADGVFDRPISSVLDVGSGTGFLGIGIAQHVRSLEEAYLTDWLLTPATFSKLNWVRNCSGLAGTAPRLFLRLGMGFHFSHHRDLLDRSNPLDLCVCNPPYLPDLDAFDEVKISHTVGGTDLLGEIIELGPEVADTVYVSFSDVALDAARRAATDVGVELHLVDEKWEVPFRVAQALEVDSYTRQLVDHGLTEREGGRYRYWHDVGTYKIVD